MHLYHFCMLELVQPCLVHVFFFLFLFPCLKCPLHKHGLVLALSGRGLVYHKFSAFSTNVCTPIYVALVSFFSGFVSSSVARQLPNRSVLNARLIAFEGCSINGWQLPQNKNAITVGSNGLLSIPNKNLGLWKGSTSRSFSRC